MGIFKDLICIVVFTTLMIALFKTDNIYLALILIPIFIVIYVIRLVILHKQKKKYLMNRMQIFEMMFNSSRDIILYRDINANIIACNRMLEVFLDIPKEELINNSLKKIFTRSLVDTEHIRKILYLIDSNTKQAIKTGESTQFFEKFIFVDNRVGYFNVLISPACGENGEVLGSIIVARDVTSEHLVSVKATENEELLKCILENMPICAFMKDRYGNFVIGSSPFEKFINCKNAEMKKLNLHEIFGEEYLYLVKQEDEEVLRTKQSLHVTRKVVFPLQSFLARITKTPVFDTNGDVKYIVIMYENIENEREIELQKEYFIETLIHDLKIPTLAQLRGLELIRNETLGTINLDQKELLTQIQSSCRYILDMISMVLKTYRLENGQKKLILEKFDFSELLSECFNELTHQAKDKNITFIYESNYSKLFVEADRADIRTLVLNLLSNSIMYTHQNEKVYVDADIISNQIKVSIKSRGIILSEREYNSFFDKTSSKTPQYTTIGHGIGLYLCKKIIESHYGQIFAISENNTYNKYTFIFPLEHKSYLANPKTTINV